MKNKMPPIAVVGIGALFPGGTTPDAFWRTIVSGRDCITDIPPSHWLVDDYYDPDPTAPGKTYARRGAFLENIDFDPLEHGIPPNLASSIDTAQLLALIVAKRLLETSCDFTRIARDRTSVVLGVASATELVSTMSGSLQRPVIERALRELDFPEAQVTAACARVSQSYVDWTESTFPGLLGNVVAGRIANRFDLGGTNCVIDAACASSLGAIKVAIDELWTGAADLVVTGGVDAINDIFMYMCFSKTLAMSRSGDCRPFSDDADGTMLGEGIGMFALRRLTDAEQDGDHIYAVIKGIGSSSDGRAKSIYAPRMEGQAKALRRAYETSGYSPDTVELMEAHGTGTAAGDAAEVSALKEVFGERPSDGTRCALGSVKSQIGHTKAAAGAASLYKIAMALHHKILPPTIKVRQPNATLGLQDSPFYLNTTARPWIAAADHPRRASLSSFGFGGSNYHLTLEEYLGPSVPPRIRIVDTELFLFSADQTDALAVSVSEALNAARSDFASAARRSQKGFSTHKEHRLAIVAKDSTDLAAKVDHALASIRAENASRWNPTGIAYGMGIKEKGKIAFLFPGQGSQYVGMGASLAMAFPEARVLWDSAPLIARKVFPPPVFDANEREAQLVALADTSVAQPAIGIASRICLELLEAAGIRPNLCAGHSFGEVTALFAAGVFSAETFLKVACERGALMASAAETLPGAMAAVAASEMEIRALLPTLDSQITVANINGPRQVVLAGSVRDIEAVSAQLVARGFTIRRLPVATAFHSTIVEPAAAPFTAFLDTVEFCSAAVPIFSNTTSGRYPQGSVEARRLLGAQLANPVRFAEEIQALYNEGARIFIEVGPGAVLTDLVGACLADKAHLAIATDAKNKDAVTSLWSALAQLAAVGVPFDMEFAWKDRPTMNEEMPQKSAATISISGTNFGKKYPAPNPNPVPSIPETLLAPATTVTPDERFETVQLIQEKMAEAHAAAQRAMTESHMAYLRASEAILNSFVAGRPIAEPEIPSAVAAPVHIATPFTEPAQAVAPPPTVTQIASPRTPAPSTQSGIKDLVLSIISEQTGYPRDVLTADMDLEADLGIDSIKRVQIFAAIQEKRSDFPEIETSSMANMRTIGAIVSYLDGPTTTSTPTGNVAETPIASSIVRLGLQAVEAPAAVVEKSMLVNRGKLAIVGCTNGIGTALAERLGHHGIQAAVFADVPADAGATVFLDFEGDAGQNLTAHARRIFDTAKSFTVSEGGRDGALILVQERGPAWRSGINAFAKTVAAEQPRCTVRAIEIERGERSPTELAEIIANEILTSDSTNEIAVDANGRRTVLQEVDRPIIGEPDLALLAGQPVIVVSGGARGVAAACLIALAGVAPLRVAMIGRTALIPESKEIAGIQDVRELQAALLASARARGESPAPKKLASQARIVMASREIRQNLAVLERLGSEAVYLSADVTDTAATKQVISDVRSRWGRVDMLIHAAGLIADKRLSEKSFEQFMEVYGTKVLGLRSLLEATDDDPLRFIGLFSSVAGRYGNAGQSDYAMANAALNRIAGEQARRRGSRCVVRSLNWGPWDGGMVTPELRDHFAAKGVSIMSMQEGAAAFVRELCHPSTELAEVDVVLAARSKAKPTQIVY